MLMTIADFNFLKTIYEIKNNGTEDFGEVRPKYLDGTPAHTKFITQVFETYDLEKGEFPIISFRKIAWQSAIKEILWIYQDQSNNLELFRTKYGITWWDSWDIGDGTIGQRYGATVKRYDLINSIRKDLKESPNSRRMVMNLYQYEDMNETPGLHPCAMETLFSVRDGRLDMTLIQRSSDYLVANHINKIQYVALQLMLAKEAGLIPGKFSHLVNDCHIYDRHWTELEKMIPSSEVDVIIKNYDGIGNLKNSESLPKLVLNTNNTNFCDFTIDDFEMVNYHPKEVEVKFELGI